jgi:non-specific serine/threonine protein kinase
VIVLHGVWRDDRLALWAEDSTLPPAPPSRAAATRHPFATKIIDLPGGAPGSLDLRLPTRSGLPADPPELVRSEVAERQRSALTLRAWSVPTLEYGPDEALATLAELDPATVTMGASLRHLATVASFAHDLAARGRVLPAVLVDGPRAVWRPY